MDTFIRLLFPAALGLAEQCSRLRGFRRALFERSELRSRRSWRTAEGTRRATHGQTWFWVLLPKQKDLLVQ
jgi:hypothetical protein